MRTRKLALALAPVLLLACEQRPSPTAPERILPDPALSIVDGSSLSGLEGFRFLPPIVSGPATGAGEFDPSVLDLLAVEICEWTAEGCADPPIRRITADDGPPEGLRLNRSAEVYRALWDTRRYDLDPAKTYRVRVLASGGEIGHADVDVVEMGEEGAEDMVRLELGDGLPIRFRITEELGQRAGSEATTLTLAGGDVEFEIPAGALDEDVLLTAAPATDLPPNAPPIVPGTAWDFGPDGLEFDVPVRVTIRYDPADLPPGTEESELRIHELVDGMFVQQDAGVVDLENHEVSALVDGFSVFVVLERLYPGSPEDLEGPRVEYWQVLDQGTSTWGSSTTVDVGAGDAGVDMRLSLLDDISGVSGIYAVYVSPSGEQRQFPCYPFDPQPPQPPTSGSDTYGTWHCPRPWPRYSEAGTWMPQVLQLEDKVGNYSSFRPTASGFCDFYDPTQCIAAPPTVTVASAPDDLTPPSVTGFGVSADVQPRVFRPSVSVDVATTYRWVVFGLDATDDLAGIEPYLPTYWHYVSRVYVRGPSGQIRNAACFLESGTSTDGAFECYLYLPQLAEPGTWSIYELVVPDRVGNGYWTVDHRYRSDGSGDLCTTTGDCVVAPTIEVTSLGDGEAPFLQALSLSVTDATVTVTMLATDDQSGVSYARPLFQSTVSTQDYYCFTSSPVSGSDTNGTWECSFTFPEFSAKGEWTMSLYLQDQAGNGRSYSRRASDGFLCYWDPDTATQVCQDFGDTSVIVQ